MRWGVCSQLKCLAELSECLVGSARGQEGKVREEEVNKGTIQYLKRVEHLKVNIKVRKSKKKKV